MKRPFKCFRGYVGLLVMAITLTINGCAADGIMPDMTSLLPTEFSLPSVFLGDDCSTNQVVAGAVGYGSMFTVISLAMSKDKKKGAIKGAAGGIVVGTLLGTLAEKQCHQKAQKKALDAAVAKYEQDKRDAEAAEKKAAQVQATRKVAKPAESIQVANNTTSSRPVPDPPKKPAPIISDPAPTRQAPVELQYDEITWNVPSGTSGAVRPNKVYEDVANSRLCTDFQETVNNDQGKAVTQSTTKCRNTDGNWVEA